VLKRPCFKCDSRLRLQLHSLHPDDPAIQFEHRPERPDGSCNSQTLKHFLYFTRAVRVAERDRSPGFQVRSVTGLWPPIPCPPTGEADEAASIRRLRPKREREFHRESTRLLGGWRGHIQVGRWNRAGLHSQLSWLRSARNPWASSSFWPARPARARVRRASVAAKSGAASSCPAA